MATGTAESRITVRLARLSGATALAFVLASMVVGKPALAQDVSGVASNIPSDSQMLLEADTLTYDQDNNTVIAAGGVQIEYGGNRLVADKVTYNRKTQRLTATGNVHIIESGGNNIYTEEIDITDDFLDGFVNTLRVETVDKTYFAAESAERKEGVITTFNNGVYTACEPCEEKPDKAPIWRVKSRKIIWDGQAKTIRFERANFELFGLPIASLPFFEIADPTVKRKSGFLFPSFSFNSELGMGVSVPYYFALSPTYDLTWTGTGYTKQGFLTEAEWHQRFNSDEYSFKIAGIHQRDPYSFDVTTVDRGPEYDLNTNRFMAATKGEFKINPRWTFGWDALYQSDKNFSRTYAIDGYAQSVHQSEVYLTGFGERNYFDLRFMRFQVQEELRDGENYRYFNDGTIFDTQIARNDKQPWVLPSFDYSMTPDQPVFGGELNIDLNSRTIKRDERDLAVDADDPVDLNDPVRHVFAVRGIEGTSHRSTAEAEWKREFVTGFGLVITPILHMQGDANFVDASGDSIAAINDMATYPGYAAAGIPGINAEANIRSEYFRYMATAGLDVRWPVLFSTTSATHVLEPVAQIFARPDERYAGTLGIPNEDAQSLVFDTSSLFERDKFSGYDRIEGGTRANLGVRYSGSFSNGWTTNAMFGQSYHLGGLNSYSSPDLVNVGAFSGLETDQSDFVGLVGFTTPGDYSGSLSGRFDEKTFEARRLESKLAYTSTPLSLNAKYAFIAAQPLYGLDKDRHEISFGASKKIRDYWRVFGSGTYDLESNLLVQNSFGIGYADKCFTIALTYSESRKYVFQSTDIEKDQTIGFNLSFRTLGDFGTSSGGFGTSR